MPDSVVQGGLSPANVRTIHKNIDVLERAVDDVRAGGCLPDVGSREAGAALRAVVLAPPGDAEMDLRLVLGRCDLLQVFITSLLERPRWQMAAGDLQVAVTDLRIDVLGLDATELEMCRRQFGPLGPIGDPLPPWVAAEAFDLRRRGRTLLEIAFRFGLGGDLAADRAVRQGAIDRLAPLAEIYRPAAVEQLDVPLPELFADLNRPPPQAVRAAWQIVAILHHHAVLVGLFPSPPPKRRLIS